jgi:hypothetical protein
MTTPVWCDYCGESDPKALLIVMDRATGRVRYVCRSYVHPVCFGNVVRCRDCDAIAELISPTAAERAAFVAALGTPRL